MPWVRTSVVCALVCAACGSDELVHGVPDDLGSSTSSASATSFAVTTESPSSSAGNVSDTNFPEPALTNCGDVNGFAIDGLIAAWGVRALPGANLEEGSIRLRLSEQPTFDCRQSFRNVASGDVCLEGGGSGGFNSSGFFGTSGSSGGGECGWAIAFTLGPNEVTEGTHDLGHADRNFEVLIPDVSPPLDSVRGTLEIEKVPQGCIVGQIKDLIVDETRVFEGWFAAQLCDSMCVPTASRDCPF